MEEKDKVRVAVRIRPNFPKKEDVNKVGGDILRVVEVDNDPRRKGAQSPRNKILLLSAPTSRNSSKNDEFSPSTQKQFTFDHIFDVNSAQEEVFATLGVDIVKNALEGYHTCLFAYGQTGSGKTFTMLGATSGHEESGRGVIPRVCDNLFEEIHVLKSQGVIEGSPQVKEFKVEVSYMEIYNERVRDLLNQGQGSIKSKPEVTSSSAMKRSTSMTSSMTTGTPQNPRSFNSSMSSSTSSHSLANAGLMGASTTSNSSSSTSSSTYLKVREHNVLGPYVDGLSILAVESSADILNLLDAGNKTRTVAATNMNSESSRSHAVFTLILTQRVNEGLGGDEGDCLGMEKVSRISLVDLAGSERANKTGAVGDRLKEGSNINKSLTTLGLVISKLAEGSSGGGGSGANFIPYRDSVLTWLLKDNLGGNSRTFMIATVSPCSEHYEETLSTLRYADRAKKIVNHAVVNEDPNTKLIRELQEEVKKLKEQLGKPEPLKSVEIEGEIGEELGNENLTEQISLSERLILQASESWCEKLKRSERIQAERVVSLQKMGISLKSSGISTDRFSLVNLNSDPSLSGLLVYYVDKPLTLVGSLYDSSSPPTSQELPDIQLSGLGIKRSHCELRISPPESNPNSERTISILPHPGARTFVNGESLPLGSEHVLHHGDRILFGNHHFFRLNCPSNSQSSEKLDEKSSPESSTNEYEAAREEYWRKSVLEHSERAETLLELERKHQEEKQEALERQRKDLERQFTTLMTLVNVKSIGGLSSTCPTPSEEFPAFPFGSTPSNPNPNGPRALPTIHSMMNLNLNQLQSPLTPYLASPMEEFGPGTPKTEGIPMSNGLGAKGEPGESKGDRLNEDLELLKGYLREGARLTSEANAISLAIGVKLIGRVLKLAQDGFMRNFCSGELIKINYSLKLVIPESYLSFGSGRSHVPPPSVKIQKFKIDLRALLAELNRELTFTRAGNVENAIEERLNQFGREFEAKNGHLDEESEETWSLEKLSNRIIEMREFYYGFETGGADFEGSGRISVKMGVFKELMKGLEGMEGVFYDGRSTNIEGGKGERLIGIGNIFLQHLEYEVLTLNYPVPVLNTSGEICGILQIELTKLGILEEEDDYSVYSLQLVIRSFSALAQLENVNSVYCRYEFCGELVHVPSFTYHSEMERVKNVGFEHRRVFSLLWNFTESEDDEDSNENTRNPKSLAIQVWASQAEMVHSTSNAFEDKLEEEEEEDLEEYEDFRDFRDPREEQLAPDGIGRPATSKSVTERWKEVTSHIKFWVEIQELNEHGEWSPVDVIRPTSSSKKVHEPEINEYEFNEDEGSPEDELIGSGGVYLLRLGQQRRIRLSIGNCDEPGGEVNLMRVPIVFERVEQVAIGALTLRSTTLQTPLDSYQEEDLNTLRCKWGEALFRRRAYLDSNLQLLAKKSVKTKEEMIREDSLVAQWLLLTEERDAVLLPKPNSGVPGAPINRVNIREKDEFTELHKPILFLDLSEEMLNDPLSLKSPPAKVKVVGLNNLLPKEHGAEFVGLPLLSSESNSNGGLSATVAWDSSCHQGSGEALNRPTGRGFVVYLILRLSVRLSHPVAGLTTILRKRICTRIVPSSARSAFYRQCLHLVGLENGGGGGVVGGRGSGVVYQVVSHLPPSSEQLEGDKEQMLNLAVQSWDGGDGGRDTNDVQEEGGEDAMNNNRREKSQENSQLNCEIYLEEFLRSLSTIDTILNLDRMRQSIALREQIEKNGGLNVSLRSSEVGSPSNNPNPNLLSSLFSNLKSLGSNSGRNLVNLRLFKGGGGGTGSIEGGNLRGFKDFRGMLPKRIRKTYSVPNFSNNLAGNTSHYNLNKLLIHEENEDSEG